MKKKVIILILAIAVIGGLSWYAKKLMDKSGKSDTELFDFAIKDIEKVDKIVLEDPWGYAFEVTKKGNTWVDKNGKCVLETNVEFILDALKKIEFKGYLPEKSKETYTKMMIGQHTKVDFHVNGRWEKTWYIGPAAPDHYSQVMLLDSREQGKSDLPVMMRIKGHNGFIEPRFSADPRKWQCTNIFSIPADKISKVELKFIDEPARSFTVKRTGNDLKVYQQDKLLADAKRDMVLRYLNNYKKVHYDIPNYSLTDKQVDSLKKTTPFAMLTLSETTGQVSKLRMWHIPIEGESTNEFGVVVNHDTDKFWCELPSGELVKCQFFVFNPLLLGHIYFPLDMTGVRTGSSEIAEPERYHK